MSSEIELKKSKKKSGDLMKVRKITEDFFAGINGKLLSYKYFKIKTYSSQNIKISCLNYYIGFANKNLFGLGDFSEEIYPRYRKMRSDWRGIIKQSGVDMSRIAVGFVPLLISAKKVNFDTFKYKKESKKPVGEKVIKINSTSPAYYQKMAEKFGVKFTLKEANGLFIGPERGMMEVIEVISKILKKIDCFVDVGAGSGEISAYILKNSDPKKIVVNEISCNLKKHLKEYLKSSHTKIVFNFKDCQKIKIPQQVNLMSVGVFYGSQPSFIESRGGDIVKSLGQEGILLIQSSMPETLFSQHILIGDLDSIKKWPWYSKKFILSNNFSYVESFFIDNQFVTIASQSNGLIEKIMKKLSKKIIPYNKFK